MNNKMIGLLIFIVFILEGTWIHWLVPMDWYNGLLVAPHLVLVLVLFLSIIRNRHLGLFFGLLFGLMHDIVYASPMIGPHSFSMGLTAYAAGVIAKRLKITMVSALFIISFFIVLYDVVNYAVFRMFRDYPYFLCNNILRFYCANTSIQSIVRGNHLCTCS